MLNCGKLLVRVGAPYVIAKELNLGMKHAGAKTFCAIAASTIHVSESSSSTSSTSKSQQQSQKVDTSCCGFAKDLVGSTSTVLDNNIYGEDACFIARYKSTHVAGEYYCSLPVHFDLRCCRWSWGMETIWDRSGRVLFKFNAKLQRDRQSR